MEYYPSIREQPIRGELERVAEAVNYIPQVRLGSTLLGLAKVTSNQTGISTVTDLTNLSVTVNVPYGGRYIKITGYGRLDASTADVPKNLFIFEGSTQLNYATGAPPTGSGTTIVTLTAVHIEQATPGSHTYKLRASSDSGTTALLAASDAYAFILVELI